jgi:hypothetical protein
MSVYTSGDYRLELDKQGRLYYKEMLTFFGDTHLAISMFIRNSTDIDLNLKLKKRINIGV